MNNSQFSMDWLVKTLKRIESSMRGGHFIYAYREMLNLITCIERGEVGLDDVESLQKIAKRLRRAANSIRPVVEAEGNANAALHIACEMKVKYDSQLNQGQQENLQQKG